MRFLTVTHQIFNYRRGQIYPSGDWRIMVSGHKSKRRNMGLNYVRTQVKIEKDGFIYVRTQVKTEKDGFICPDTSKN